MTPGTHCCRWCDAKLKRLKAWLPKLKWEQHWSCDSSAGFVGSGIASRIEVRFFDDFEIDSVEVLHNGALPDEAYRHLGWGQEYFRSDPWRYGIRYEQPNAEDMRDAKRVMFAIERAGYGDYLRSPGWRTRRNDTLKRDGFACVKCKAVRDLQVHHLTYARIGHEEPGDLVTLCRSCHEQVESRVQGVR